MTYISSLDIVGSFGKKIASENRLVSAPCLGLGGLYGPKGCRYELCSCHLLLLAMLIVFVLPSACRGFFRRTIQSTTLDRCRPVDVHGTVDHIVSPCRLLKVVVDRHEASLYCSSCMVDPREKWEMFALHVHHFVETLLVIVRARRSNAQAMVACVSVPRTMPLEQ